MKIAYALDGSLDVVDGVQQYVLIVGEWMRQRGHEVHYLAGQTNRNNLQGLVSLSRNIGVNFNGNALSTPLPASHHKLQAVMNDINPDIVHVQVPYSPYLVGRLIENAPKHAAVIGTFHVLPYGKMAVLGSDILAKVNAKTANRFDAMIANSLPTQTFAAKHFGFRSTVLPLPIDFERFASARPSSAVGNRPRILFLGRLVPRKGAMELLEAVNVLRKIGPDRKYDVVIAGRGESEKRLKDYVLREGLSKDVTFLGYIEESDKASLLASADIITLPSKSGESFGISLLEAMAASKGIVLAGDNPGYASVIASSEQLIDPCDSDRLAKKLAYWIDQPEKRQKIAILQRRHAKQYDSAVVMPMIESLYVAVHAARMNIK